GNACMTPSLSLGSHAGSREIAMAVHTSEGHLYVRFWCLDEIACGRCRVELLDRAYEGTAVPSVLRVFQGHPPRIVGEAFELATLNLGAGPVTGHDALEDLLSANHFLAHDTVALGSLRRHRRTPH